MRIANQSAAKIVRGVNRRTLNNNVQRVLLSLVSTSNNDGWVARTALRIPSVGSRIRDLRKVEFGGFRVECVSATDLNRRPSEVTSRQTYYRVVPSTVTVKALSQVLKGVI
jgi:hypothetical protein